MPASAERLPPQTPRGASQLEAVGRRQTYPKGDVALLPRGSHRDPAIDTRALRPTIHREGQQWQNPLMQ